MNSDHLSNSFVPPHPTSRLTPETLESSDLEPPSPTDPIQQMADTIGQMMEFWGFKHIMGRLWTTLYLSSYPLSAPELAQRMGVSSGAVSMAIRDLMQWGAIRKMCLKDSRKDHYTAEKNIWKLVSRVLAQREGRRIEAAFENIEETLKALKLKKKSDSETQYQIEQINELKKLTKVASRLLKFLLLTNKIDCQPFIELNDNESLNAERTHLG